MFPSKYLDVILNYISTKSTNTLSESFQKLSEGYRTFKSDTLGSTKQDVDAYLIGRLPLTFSVISHVLEQIQDQIPDNVSIIDYGCGPATALLALDFVFGSGKYEYLGFEEKHAMIEAAKSLSQTLDLGGKFIQTTVESFEPVKSELAIVSYLLNELTNQNAFFDKILELHEQILLIEPGTPDGFSRVIEFRKLAIERGFHVIKPCPHQHACPMKKPNWCHFYKRVERPKILKAIKKGSLGYEDEKYSYVFVSKTPPSNIREVIVNFPKILPYVVEFDVCSTNGLIEHRQIFKKDKQEYKIAKKYDWGDFV